MKKTLIALAALSLFAFAPAFAQTDPPTAAKSMHVAAQPAAAQRTLVVYTPPAAAKGEQVAKAKKSKSKKAKSGKGSA